MNEKKMDKKDETQSKGKEMGEATKQSYGLENTAEILNQKEPEPVVEEPEVNLDDAKGILNQIKEERRLLQEDMEKAREIKGISVLSGKSEAGSIPPTINPDEKLTLECKEILKGTGFERLL